MSCGGRSHGMGRSTTLSFRGASRARCCVERGRWLVAMPKLRWILCARILTHHPPSGIRCLLHTHTEIRNVPRPKTTRVATCWRGHSVLAHSPEGEGRGPRKLHRSQQPPRQHPAMLSMRTCSRRPPCRRSSARALPTLRLPTLSQLMRSSLALNAWRSCAPSPVGPTMPCLPRSRRACTRPSSCERSTPGTWWTSTLLEPS